MIIVSNNLLSWCRSRHLTGNKSWGKTTHSLQWYRMSQEKHLSSTLVILRGVGVGASNCGQWFSSQKASLHELYPCPDVIVFKWCVLSLCVLYIMALKKLWHKCIHNLTDLNILQLTFMLWVLVSPNQQQSWDCLWKIDSFLVNC